ncbi:AsmA-like C-terminal region-containing protein [Azorhizobium sp. AG788]|uniref:YhdP family protein n=1 Tax=Azorhizobium sp. AG788 TaxID=2183897 RepID=UPI00313A1747
MGEDQAQFKSPVRMPRRSHLRGLTGALIPRSRVARALVGTLLLLMGLAGLGALVIYGLVAAGIVTANLATPYIERAIADRLDGKYVVRIGSTAVETMQGGATVVIARDISLSEPDGTLVASAPSAEVELEGSLLTLTPKARRFDLIGAEMTVRIGAKGEVAVAAGKGARLLSTGAAPPEPDPRPPAPAPGAQTQTQLPQGQGAAATATPAAPAGAAPNAAAPNATDTGAAADLGGDPLVMKAFADWLNALEQSGFDGGALSDVGLKDGSLVVQNEATGRQIRFDNISVRLGRTADGGAVFTFTSQQPHGLATLVATIGAARNGERPIDLVLKDVSTRDLVQAFSQDLKRFYMDTPLGATLRARIANDGRILAAEAGVSLGAGQLGNGEDPEERFVIDYAQARLVLDPAQRVINVEPLTAAKNANKIALKAVISVPSQSGQSWPYEVSPVSIVLAGPEMNDPPLIVSDFSLTGRYTPPDKKLLMEKGDLSNATGALSFSGLFDFGVPVPYVQLKAIGSRMPSATVKRFWPVTLAPPARTFVLENLSGGTVDGTSVNVNMALDLIGQKDVPLPEDAVRLDMTASGITLRAVKGLPPLVNTRLSVAVTGRSVRVNIPEATVVTPQNRKLAVSDGVFMIPDYFPREPSGLVKVKFDGPADAGIEVLGMEALKGSEGQAFDPSTTRGKLSALLQVKILFHKVPQPGDVDYSLEAKLTDFGVDKIFQNQRLEGASVDVFASPAGVLLRGDGKVAGAPLTFEYDKKKDKADADVRVNATLDDASRQKLGVDISSISGPIAVKLVGTTNNKQTRAAIELDLTAARILDLVPGLTKPAGKPLKAKFTSNDAGKTIRIDDLILDGSGTYIRGALELSDEGDVVSANFPSFQLSDGDKASLRAERSGDVLKIRITGEVVDARGIMKSLVGTPSGPAKKEQKSQDVDVEAKIGAMTGNNGEVLRQLDLSVGRRGVELRSFSLTAKAGREGTVAGEIRNWGDTPRRALYVSTSDAGAVLRFLDTYGKMQGGTMWVIIDPPRGDTSPQNGVVNLRDFVIRGEPGLDSLSAAARDSSGKVEQGTAVFEKAQAQFTRTTGKIAIRDGAIWGPVAGVTAEGTIDFTAERISMRGTYVPAYGLNNLFSKLPIIGAILGGGPNEGLLGVTFEITGPMSGPTLRINPLSAVAPGFLRKMFEFRGAGDGKTAP